MFIYCLIINYPPMQLMRQLIEEYYILVVRWIIHLCLILYQHYLWIWWRTSDWIWL